MLVSGLRVYMTCCCRQAVADIARLLMNELLPCALPRWDEVAEVARKVLATRYRLLPYLYACAWQTHTTGMPLIRSLGLAFPESEQAWSTVDAFLYGPALLIAPISQQGATKRTLALPPGTWWDFWTGKPITGGSTVTLPAPLESMPVLVRAGSIVATGPVRQYADEPTEEPLLFTVYPGADGTFTHYDDDGISFAYEKGTFATLDCVWNDAKRTLSFHRGRGDGALPRSVQVCLAGGRLHTANLSGSTTVVQL